MSDSKREMIQSVVKSVLDKYPGIRPEEVPPKVKAILDAFYKMGMITFTIDLPEPKITLVTTPAAPSTTNGKIDFNINDLVVKL